MFCSNPACRRQLPDGASFCKYCGERQTAPISSNPYNLGGGVVNPSPYGNPPMPDGTPNPYPPIGVPPTPVAPPMARGPLGRAWDDFRQSPDKLVIALKLALFQFLPFVGGLVETGYAYTWGKEASFGRIERLPRKIIRPGVLDAGLYSWGASTILTMILGFALFLISLVLGAVFGLGGPSGALVGSVLAVIINIVLFVLINPVISLLCMRSAICGRLRSGFAFSHAQGMMATPGKAGKLIGLYWGAMLAYFGVMVLVGLVFSAVFAGVGYSMAGSLGSLAYGLGYGYSAVNAIGTLVGSIFALFPLVVIMLFVVFFVRVSADMVVARAIGYWLQDFRPDTWPEYLENAGYYARHVI